MSQKPFQRDNNGARLGFHGMNIVRAPDDMPPGKFPYCQNVRAYRKDMVTSRATQDAAVETLPASIHTLRRLNDTTPAGPFAGFILVAGAADKVYAGTTQVASGMSGNPLSFIPFRPDASVQPWMYIGDSLQMIKVRSDGTQFKMGIVEPQTAPSVVPTPASDTVSLIGPVTVYYFNNPSQSHNPPLESVYIWKNASDPVGGSTVIESIAQAAGVTSGNSLLFDDGVNVGGANPVAWTQYTTNNGTVNTLGTAVTWVGGSQFNNLLPGNKIVINALTYTILTVNSSISITLTTSAGTQTDVNYFAAAKVGTVPLFLPALESQGYQDFNVAILATLYIPAAGTYTLSFSGKDDFLWGIGGTANGTANWAGPTGSQTLSTIGQSKTTINAYPLMPRLHETSGEDGFVTTASVAVTFSAAGNYPIEIDWNYWFHKPRGLQVKCNGVDIPPIPGSVITQAQYRYRYRSSATGAKSNPSPASAEQSVSALANRLMFVASDDPQVDKIDIFRLDSGLENYTYVGTFPNLPHVFHVFTDNLLDVDVAANPLLEFDNFEPFPSIDLPRKGKVSVADGIVTYVSGDQFNIRWLPCVIIVGTVAYTLDTRPTSSTTLTASNTEIIGGISTRVPVPDGTNLDYEIAEPILAAQPLPYLWGPTDNVSFFFGVGDPLRPGTLYWSKGNNPDSAPDTNQQDVTSPSEPLQNGCIVNGLGWVASTERAWLIYPNFFNALATVQGTEGSTWTLQESSLKRGLYIPRCLAVDGGGNVFFRAKDGIYVSPGGIGGKSITDDDLFNLFPHEGMIPQSVARGGFTVYPPDDTQPQAQQLNVANGYLYYDYLDAAAIPRTLVFDIAAGGWAVDVYQTPVTVHILEEGPEVNGVLCGGSDGSVRPLTNSGAEVASSVILMPSFNAGETRAEKKFGDLYIEAGTVTS